LKRGTPRHPKMYALAEALTIPLPYAVGIMEMLWHHAAQHTPRGDIGSIPDQAIKESCCFARKPAVLIDALTRARWIHRHEDHRLYLHDWPDHCEQAVIKLLESRRQDFLPIYGKPLALRKKISRDYLPSREALALDNGLEDLKEKKDGEILRPDFDEQWQDFVRLYHESGKALIPEDFTKAHFIWRVLDFAQRTEALAKLAERKLLHDPQFIPKPERFLQGGEYARAVVARQNGNGLSRHDQIRRAMEEA